MQLKIICTGLGGQGVIFLSRLIAKAAIQAEVPVMLSETHGMSQRGGSVVSHLKLGDDLAPLIRRGTADLMFSMDADEAVRQLPYLRPGGVAFVSSEMGIRPEVQDALDRLRIGVNSLPAGNLALEMGLPAVANVILAGFSAAHPDFPFTYDQLKDCLSKVAERGLELNLQALEVGFSEGSRLFSHAETSPEPGVNDATV